MFNEYVSSDILLFCSTYEGFGLPILEAQSVGRVVITSRIEPMAQITGDGGYLVDPLNYLSIREGILNVINNSSLRNNLINNGFENIKKYSASDITRRYLRLYKDIYLDLKKNY